MVKVWHRGVDRMIEEIFLGGREGGQRMGQVVGQAQEGWVGPVGASSTKSCLLCWALKSNIVLSASTILLLSRLELYSK